MIQVKKGAKVIDMFMVTIIGFMAFAVGFQWLMANAEEANIAVEGRYNDSFNNLTQVYDAANSKVEQIRNATNSIQEAESTYYSAFYGFRGFYAIFSLPITYLSAALDGLNIAFGVVDYTNVYVISAMVAGITVLIIFAAVTFFTQRSTSP